MWEGREGASILGKSVLVGNVQIGGGAAVSVQSMTNTKTEDVAATVAQINELAAAGCDIVRVAVPTMEAARAIGEIKEQVQLPIVADIHFDHRLALAAMESGVDALRLNPGNISGEENIREVAVMARRRGIPIRVGVNGGSIKDSSTDGMVEAALEQIKMLNRYRFDDIVVSLKSSDVRTTIEANRRMRAITGYPLHLGVTEAGLAISSAVKSALGIGTLLLEGIGDTIRVSVTGDVVREVEIAEEILSACGMGRGVEVIACPTCGRCEVDLAAIAEEIYARTRGMRERMQVAVMGCGVNGPGEASHADLGVACGRGEGLIFRKGEVVRKVGEGEIVGELMREIKSLTYNA